MEERVQGCRDDMHYRDRKCSVNAIEDAKEDENDYLSKLPTEIWLEILSLALLPSPPDSPFEFDPFGLDTLPSQEILYHRQYMRLHTLTICKALFPLMEQLLFADVILRDQRQYELFLTRIKTNTFDNRYRGEWTKRIYIHAMYPSQVLIHLESVLTYCPNVISLELGYGVKSEEYDFAMREKITTTLRHLLWRSICFDQNILQSVFCHFPNLAQLGIFDYKNNGNISHTRGTFNSLKQLITCGEFATHRDSSKVIMPSLQAVNIAMSSEEMESMVDFFTHYGPNITHLRLTEGLFSLDLQSFPTGSRLFDDVCPYLNTIEFNPTLFNPITISNSTRVITHSQLTHLRLAFEWSYNSSHCIQLHAQYFSSTRFPSLQFVTAILWKTKHPDNIGAFLKEMFPNAVIAVDLSRFEPVPYVV